jgi:hypothetical protein
MNYNIMKYLPYYLVHRFVIPYTYELQSKPLLADIRSFKRDYNMLENTYLVMYNSRILYNDLVFFCNNKSYHLTNVYDLTNISERYIHILRRFVTYKHKNDDDIRNMVVRSRATLKPYECLSHARLLWGLLTPLERTDFINKHILEDEIDS